MSDGLCASIGYVVYVGWLTHSPNTEVLGVVKTTRIAHDDDQGRHQRIVTVQTTTGMVWAGISVGINRSDHQSIKVQVVVMCRD